MNGDKRYDVAIVGGGPAGMSAAIWSARYLHSVALVDSGDPRNWETRGIYGYLGLEGIRPPQLRERGRETCRELGVRLIDTIVLRAEQHGEDDFELCLEGGGKVVSRRLLLAIGVRDVWPDVPGLDHAYGANAHVCPDCDGFGARGKKVVVIGHGRRAVGMALDLDVDERHHHLHQRPESGMDEPISRKADALNIRYSPRRSSACAAKTRITCRCSRRMQLDADIVPSRRAIPPTISPCRSAASATTRGTWWSTRTARRRCNTSTPRATWFPAPS